MAEVGAFYDKYFIDKGSDAYMQWHLVHIFPLSLTFFLSHLISQMLKKVREKKCI